MYNADTRSLDILNLTLTEHRDIISDTTGAVQTDRQPQPQPTPPPQSMPDDEYAKCTWRCQQDKDLIDRQCMHVNAAVKAARLPFTLGQKRNMAKFAYMCQPHRFGSTVSQW